MTKHNIQEKQIKPIEGKQREIITIIAGTSGLEIGDLIFTEEFQDGLIANKAMAGPEGRRAEYVCLQRLQTDETGKACRICKLILTDTSNSRKQYPVYLSATEAGKFTFDKQQPSITGVEQIQKVGTITKVHNKKGQILFNLPGRKIETPEIETPKIETPKETPEESKEKKPRYSFPTVSKCPRCGAIETVAYTTKGKVQYRRCLRAICRWRYSVIGTKM